MNVLVVGGSGFVGTELRRELVERGHAVTVLSRDPDVASDAAGVRAVSGDVTDYDSIESAFEGQDAVVNLVALSPLFKPRGGDEMHDRVHRGGTENVVAAAEASGVERLVQMSALGADPGGPTAYIRAKGDAERVVRESSPEWVVVRPSVVFGDGGEFVSFTKTLTTPYVTGLPGGGKTRFQPIWLGDLAPMLADCVERDEHAGETYELGGPEVLTLAEVAKLAYRAEGKSVRVLSVPMALARIGLTVGGAIPGFPMGADQYRSLRFDNTVAENDVRAFGVDPGDLRTLSEYLGLGESASESESSQSAGSAA
ncbi:complex I NDUFA9 subunit family protein [Halopelagius fulvigenes]|uniref:Complex I NDUFA9 subunit family protein n=1 Tax=Halopelagius fulvigenes TaxID=1198324 RepID=A0ABD5TZ56_9EURY